MLIMEDGYGAALLDNDKSQWMQLKLHHSGWGRRAICLDDEIYLIGKHIGNIVSTIESNCLAENCDELSHQGRAS